MQSGCGLRNTIAEKDRMSSGSRKIYKKVENTGNPYRKWEEKGKEIAGTIDRNFWM